MCHFCSVSSVGNLCFNCHIDSIFYQYLKILSLVCKYGVSVQSKFLYASVVWNSTTQMDSSELERIQRTFAPLCYNRFFNNMCDNKYKGILDRLNLSSLHSRWRHLDALFLFNALKTKISYLSILDPVNLRTRYYYVQCALSLQGYPLFWICFWW